ANQARGIGIDEKTALGVEPNGDVTMFSLCKTSGGAAYFLSTPGMPKVCEERTPLTYLDISVYKITDSSTFNLATWTGTGGTTYSLSAVDGVLTSTQPGGEIY
ncbi:MAG: peptidase, partial [Thermoplasmata archaeon]|nr:peptidase [Thermoplasmata archaeon]